MSTIAQQQQQTSNSKNNAFNPQEEFSASRLANHLGIAIKPVQTESKTFNASNAVHSDTLNTIGIKSFGEQGNSTAIKPESIEDDLFGAQQADSKIDVEPESKADVEPEPKADVEPEPAKPFNSADATQQNPAKKTRKYTHNPYSFSAIKPALPVGSPTKQVNLINPVIINRNDAVPNAAPQDENEKQTFPKVSETSSFVIQNANDDLDTLCTDRRRSRDHEQTLEEQQHTSFTVPQEQPQQQAQRLLTPLEEQTLNQKRDHTPIHKLLVNYAKNDVIQVPYPSQRAIAKMDEEMRQSKYFAEQIPSDGMLAKLMIGCCSSNATEAQIKFFFLWGANAFVHRIHKINDHHCFYVWVHRSKLDDCRRLMHRRILWDENCFWYAPTQTGALLLHSYCIDGLGLIKTVCGNQNGADRRNFGQSEIARYKPLNHQEEDSLKIALFGRDKQRPHSPMTVIYAPESGANHNNEFSPLCHCDNCKNFYNKAYDDNSCTYFREMIYNVWLQERQQACGYSSPLSVLPSIDPNDEDSVFLCHSNCTEEIYRQIGPRKLQQAQDAIRRFFDGRPDIIPKDGFNDYKGHTGDLMCRHEQTNIFGAPLQTRKDRILTLYFSYSSFDMLGNGCYHYYDKNGMWYPFSTFGGQVYFHILSSTISNNNNNNNNNNNSQ